MGLWGTFYIQTTTYIRLLDGYAVLEVYGMRDYVGSFLGKTGEEPEV